MNLEGKAITALLAGALLAIGASGCSTTGTRGSMQAEASTAAQAPAHVPPNMAAIDNQTTQDVRDALHAEHGLDARHIAVNTVGGVVQLSGTVPDAAQRARAVEIARGMSHVVGVQDNLRTTG